MSKKLHIINDRIRKVTKERDPRQEWSGEETVTSNDIKGFEVIDTKDDWKSSDVIALFEIDPSKTYYLVSVIYSTGDSFNRHDGEIEYIEMYENVDMAIATKKIIEDNYNSKDKEDKYGVEILNNEGVIYKISACWVGYFERLDEVRIDRVQQKL